MIFTRTRLRTQSLLRRQHLIDCQERGNDRCERGVGSFCGFGERVDVLERRSFGGEAVGTGFGGAEDMGYQVVGRENAGLEGGLGRG